MGPIIGDKIMLPTDVFWVTRAYPTSTKPGREPDLRTHHYSYPKMTLQQYLEHCKHAESLEPREEFRHGNAYFRSVMAAWLEEEGNEGMSRDWEGLL